jgi:hypothetical protein
MSINWNALEARAKEFNDQYRTSFDYSGFYSKLKTINRLTTDNAADIVYKGTLGTVLKDAMVAACHSRGSAKRGERGDVDLMDVVKNFEEYLMQPFVNECKSAGEKPYPKPYGGMTRMQRIELVEHMLNTTPKNDVELTERAYLKGQIRLRDIRENVNDMPFAVGKGVDTHQLQRIGAFMLAIENVNKSRPVWWRIIHPFRNNAEKRDAKELRTVLNSFGGNALEVATSLAVKEYKTLEVTKESVRNAKLELETEKREKLIKNAEEKDSVEVKLDSEIKTDLSKKVDQEVKEQPVIGKNV